MSNPTNQPAIVLMNMGGPTSVEGIEPFLLNLFNDPYIIDIPGGRWFRPWLARKIVKKRLSEAQEIYHSIGGKSPLVDISNDQAEALSQILGGWKVKVAMRYTEPFTDQALDDIDSEQPLVALPLYPHYSKTTTGSSFAELEQQLSLRGQRGRKVIWVRDYHDHPTFIQSWVESISQSLEKVPAEVRSQIPILFSAHGVPVKVIKRGDPYQDQIEKSVALICQQGGWENPHLLSFQSKVGKARWLEPSTETTLEELGDKGHPGVLVVPISFVSEHSETLFELDIMLKEIAQARGLVHYHRVPAFGTLPTYVEGLKTIAYQALDKAGIAFARTEGVSHV